MLIWDATCPDTYAPSHISATARGAGAVAAQAKHLKISKYTHLESSHLFVPIAVETSGVLGQAALDFVSDLGQRLRQVTGEARSKEYLLQKLSIAIQRGNAAAVLGTAERDRERGPFWDYPIACTCSMTCHSCNLTVFIGFRYYYVDMRVFEHFCSRYF